ncbi:probable protein disulfide-isomerase ER-60 [Drosophila suzukii]|uniref:Probable protein disulfide-isomerase ER-60 n=1 Tax=Drosophila suzukii TaxID=28584 RepID=A0AB40A8U2_DROSZ
MSRYYCGYNPPPPNFSNFLPGKFKDRLQRLPNFGQMRKSWETHKRPTLVMLHVFADDFGALEKWVEIAYRLAAPETLSVKMDVYVDDMWQSYIFNEDDFSFFRDDDAFTLDSFPLIYAVSATGEVFFFGNFSGPKLPDLDSLKDFCEQVINGNVKEPTSKDPKVEVINLASWNELVYASDKDLVICLYNSLQNGTEINNSLMINLDRLGERLKQESVRLYKMDIHDVSIPKKFNVESAPAFFILQEAQKHNPIRCKYELGTWTMLRFVAENSSKELKYYSRQGHLRLHANLLTHIRDFFDLSHKN